MSPKTQGKSRFGRPAQAVDLSTPGGKVREARLKVGWSAIKLGQEVGVSHQTIIRIELGQTRPDKTTWIRLAQILKTNFGLEWLRKHVTDEDISIPITARVAAGDAVEFFLEGEDTDEIRVDARMIKKRGKHFGLRVAGNSMEGAHVLSGDIVIVRYVPKTYQPTRDELVIADIRAEGITLKRWKNEGDETVLIPSTEGYKHIRRPAWRVKPVAVVVGVIRMIQ